MGDDGSSHRRHHLRLWTEGLWGCSLCRAAPCYWQRSVQRTHSPLCLADILARVETQREGDQAESGPQTNTNLRTKPAAWKRCARAIVRPVTVLVFHGSVARGPLFLIHPPVFVVWNSHTVVKTGNKSLFSSKIIRRWVTKARKQTARD